MTEKIEANINGLKKSIEDLNGNIEDYTEPVVNSHQQYSFSSILSSVKEYTNVTSNIITVSTTVFFLFIFFLTFLLILKPDRITYKKKDKNGNINTHISFKKTLLFLLTLIFILFCFYLVYFTIGNDITYYFSSHYRNLEKSVK